MDKPFFRFTLLAVIAWGVLGCSSDNPVPANSQIRMSPATIEWEIQENIDPDSGLCFLDPDFFQDQTLAITVVDGSGVPLGDVAVSVLLDLSGNTFPGIPRLKLYHDQNGNGVPDDPQELVSDEDDSAFRIKTDQYSGTASVIVRVNLSCEYRATVYAFADAATGTTTITVLDPDKD